MGTGATGLTRVFGIKKKEIHSCYHSVVQYLGIYTSTINDKKSIFSTIFFRVETIHKSRLLTCCSNNTIGIVTVRVVDNSVYNLHEWRSVPH